jgi:sterol desaturase/sphingolipid hydroxylase (fatty acid hydroxylase superfamily)
MRLGRWGYYTDFVLYPLLVVALVAVTWRAAPLAWTQWAVCVVVGVIVWTFAEYVLHRFVFHDIPFFARMHDTHHADPTGMIGTPSWISLAVTVFGLLLPLWWGTTFEVASGMTAGGMLGYFWYIALHHAVHHMRIEPGTYLFRVKRRHALHHFARQSCNFGVTTSMWDRLFGTYFETR